MKQNNKAVYLVLLSLVILLSMPTCGRRHQHITDDKDGGRLSEIYPEGQRYSGGVGCSRRKDRDRPRDVMPPLIYQPIYFNQSIEVQQNVSFQEALYKIDSKAQEVEQNYGVGGTKLIAEMSADAEGIYCSRDPYSEVTIKILSLDQLKLHVDYRSSIYQQILKQQIVINSSSVGFLNGPSLAEILENFLNTLLTGKLVAHLTIANLTNKTIVCEIKQGQMLEVVNENVQNLVVAETYKFSIASRQQTNMNVHVYCAARHRGDPSNSRIRFTPYFLNASSEVYENQSSVWSYIGF